MVLVPALPASITEFPATNASEVAAALVLLNDDSAPALPVIQVLLQKMDLELIALSLVLSKQALTTEPFLAAIADHSFLL